MGIIWEKRHCSVDDVLQEMPDPKPAYTTVQTFMRILEQKGFQTAKYMLNTNSSFIDFLIVDF